MQTLKHPVTVFIAGILVGYMLQRVIAQVPVVNKLPIIRI